MRARRCHLVLQRTEHPGAYLLIASTGAILTTLSTGTSCIFSQPIFAQGTPSNLAA